MANEQSSNSVDETAQHVTCPECKGTGGRLSIQADHSFERVDCSSCSGSGRCEQLSTPQLDLGDIYEDGAGFRYGILQLFRSTIFVIDIEAAEKRLINRYLFEENLKDGSLKRIGSL